MYGRDEIAFMNLIFIRAHGTALCIQKWAGCRVAPGATHPPFAPRCVNSVNRAPRLKTPMLRHVERIPRVVNRGVGSAYMYILFISVV